MLRVLAMDIMAEKSSFLVLVSGGPAGFAHATPALEGIRRARRGQRVVLLTDPEVVGLAEASPYCDAVLSNEGWDQPRGAGKLLAALRAERFELIYDLVGSLHAERLIGAVRGGAGFTGTLRGAKFPADLVAVSDMHPVEAALARSGPAGQLVDPDAKPDVSWAATARRNTPSLQPQYFSLQHPFVVLAPGGEDGPVWPVSEFAALAVRLAECKVGVAVASEPAHREAAQAVVRACPDARDLAGRADMTQLCAIAVHASAAMGHAKSDLMHLIAAAGTPTIALTTSHADAGSAPRGRSVMALAANDRDALTPRYAAEVLGMFGRVDLLRASA